MKSLSILLVLVLRVATLFAEDTSSINKVFIHKAGKDNLYVLQLKDGNAYDYMRYTNKRVYHDFGVFALRHGKITFESRNRKHGFNSVGGKTYFMSKKGLFKTRMESIFGKDAALETSDDVIYMNSWDFNPLTGKNAEDLEAEKKAAEVTKKEKSAANHAEQMKAFTKTFFVNEALNYGNEYQSLLEKHYCGPGMYQTKVGNTNVEWNMDTSRQNLVNEYGTVVHESTHTSNGATYFVIPGIEIPVTRNALYKSNEFKSIVPADAKTKIFRYETYVGDSSIVSANESGIFGMMDEFSAYENGTRADVLAAKAALANGDTVLARNFLSQGEATYFAYYEFNLFMAWYLHYAKTNHPDVYKETMANTGLRITYTMINQEFSNTIDELKSAGAAAGEGKNWLSYNDSQYAAYPKKLLVKEQPYLNEFAVKGVTHENYWRFLPEKK